MIEMYENGIRGRKEHVAKVEEFINKKNNWRLVEVPDRWQELYEEKALLMADMMHFAYARNDGWVPDWEIPSSKKWGVESEGLEEEVYSTSYFSLNCFVFGIAVKSRKIAEEMLAEFGERIEKVYNKQY